MTDDTREPTPDELAAEPAPAALRTLAFTPAAHDALALRIEAAAGAELARRALAHAVHAPRLQRLQARPAHRTRAWPPRSAPGDVAPLLARALRPAMLAAAAAALLAVGLAGGSADASDPAGQLVSDASSVQVLNLQDPSAQWADQASAPSADALGRAIGLGGAP